MSYVWTYRSSSTSQTWYAISSSSDETKLCAVVSGGDAQVKLLCKSAAELFFLNKKTIIKE